MSQHNTYVTLNNNKKDLTEISFFKQFKRKQ